MDAKPNSEVIWIYLNGEMSEADRAAFRQRLRDDPAWRDEYIELATLHAGLRDVMPLATGNMDEDLVDRLIAEFDKDQSRLAKPTAAPFVGSWRWVTGGALAAAALVVLGLALPMWMGGPIRWVERDYGQPLQVRGSDQVSPAKYTPDDLKRWGQLLESNIEATYAPAQDGRRLWARREWRLSLRMQETAFGALLIEVEGRKTGEDKPRLWQTTCKGANDMDDCLRAFAQTTAEAMRQ